MIPPLIAPLPAPPDVPASCRYERHGTPCAQVAHWAVQDRVLGPTLACDECYTAQGGAVTFVDHSYTGFAALNTTAAARAAQRYIPLCDGCGQARRTTEVEHRLDNGDGQTAITVWRACSDACYQTVRE